jgi:hypothetical protein
MSVHALVSFLKGTVESVKCGARTPLRGEDTATVWWSDVTCPDCRRVIDKVESESINTPRKRVIPRRPS